MSSNPNSEEKDNYTRPEILEMGFNEMLEIINEVHGVFRQSDLLIHDNHRLFWKIEDAMSKYNNFKRVDIENQTNPEIIQPKKLIKFTQEEKLFINSTFNVVLNWAKFGIQDHVYSLLEDFASMSHLKFTQIDMYNQLVEKYNEAWYKPLIKITSKVKTEEKPNKPKTQTPLHLFQEILHRGGIKKAEFEYREKETECRMTIKISRRNLMKRDELFKFLTNRGINYEYSIGDKNGIFEILLPY